MDDPSSPAPDLAPTPDERLLERARAGDLGAFNEVVVRHQDFLYALVARQVRDRELAADAVQEAFLHAWRNVAGYRGGAVRGWLARIALNAATDMLRSRRRRPSEPYPEWADEGWQPAAGPDADPEREATRRARRGALAEALAAIGEDQRRAILLFDVQGFDYHEIAALTGVSLGTVKSRIHRGRLALRDLLAERMELFRD